VRRVLVTGGAGFIGSHVVERLLGRGAAVTVLDSFDGFYDPARKRRNLEDALAAAGTAADRLEVIEGDLRDAAACARAVAEVDAVVHLAALAGVRPSILDPARYMDVNVVGTQRLVEALRARPGAALVFGSSSSVYGGNQRVPFAESDPVERPVSPYAASKRAGELLSYTFHHLYGSPVTCLRFFTVFGPRQRPEMAIHKFTRCILAGDKVPMFGDGQSARDYTYVDDIVDGVVAALERADGYQVFNLGGSTPVALRDLVGMLEDALGKRAVLDQQAEQLGDVRRTHADLTQAERGLGYRPRVPLAEGLRRFVAWYLAERAEGRIA
jgi:UDP-glucuronate 4-epimerase